MLNRAVLTGALADALAEQFIEVLFAPGFDPQAVDVLARKPSMRVLEHTEQRAPDDAERDYRRVMGGLLVQDRDWVNGDRESMKVVCGALLDEQWDDLLFSWRVVKHVTSNAIVLARGGQTLGIGAGQMSRVDAVRLAVAKARELGHSLERRGSRVGRVLPVRRRTAARARRGDHGDRPAGRVEARRRGDRSRLGGRRRDGVHRSPALQTLETPHAL